MKQLEIIDFGGNKLKAVSSKLLQPIKASLKYANFEDNTKINAFYDSENPQMSLEQLMKVIDTDCDVPVEEKLNFPNRDLKDELLAGFEALWSSHRFSDFTITVGTQEFPVHKAVLGAQSSVFAAIFENNMQERSEGKMAIEDFSAVAVEEFLRCLYTGEIQDGTNAMELFALAAKNEVPKMKSIAEEIILQNVNEKNAIEVLNLGNRYGSEELKEKAFEEIQKMFPNVALPSEFKDQPEDIEKLIEGDRKRKRKIKEVEEMREKNFLEQIQQHAKKLKQSDEEAEQQKEAAVKEFEMMLKNYKK
jgi:hypothetical protein